MSLSAGYDVSVGHTSHLCATILAVSEYTLHEANEH